MVFLYDFGIWLYVLCIRLGAVKSVKAGAWLDGRKNLLAKIRQEIKPNISYIWFHFASLGEFEQGRSVIERLKVKEQEAPILITFFSPSGYEIRKNYPLANHIFYLPIDTAANARELVKLINPVMAIFTKYEYWYHYFDELRTRGVPLYIISAIFRKNQPFFRFYGGLHRRMLHCVSHFFVQNQESKHLLEALSIHQVTVSGDTRFDRVADNALHPKSLNLIKIFCGGAKTFIAGSTWPEDEKLLAQVIRKYPTWKWIIAPHEVGEDKIAHLEQVLEDHIVVRYSVLESKSQVYNAACSILIIDNVGMLSSLYQYGQLAYIGGGFGSSGIHNTLEAAAFGLPVLFGPNYQKFQEAKDMIELGAAFSIKQLSELEFILNKLNDEVYLGNCGKLAKEYVRSQRGATERIISHIFGDKN